MKSGRRNLRKLMEISLQIISRRFDDLTALRVGAAVEAVMPWADRRPRI